MELKVTTDTTSPKSSGYLGANPINGIESHLCIEWVARYVVQYESNKWNWKHRQLLNQRLEYTIYLNPINGIESESTLWVAYDAYRIANPINGIESQVEVLEEPAPPANLPNPINGIESLASLNASSFSALMFSRNPINGIESPKHTAGRSMIDVVTIVWIQ